MQPLNTYMPPFFTPSKLLHCHLKSLQSSSTKASASGGSLLRCRAHVIATHSVVPDVLNGDAASDLLGCDPQISERQRALGCGHQGIPLHLVHIILREDCIDRNLSLQSHAHVSFACSSAMGPWNNQCECDRNMVYGIQMGAALVLTNFFRYSRGCARSLASLVGR